MSASSIGPYCIVRKLGAGGMGEVYLAADPRLDRHVALKTVSASSLASSNARADLLREARAVARLNHPNIAAVFDVVDQPDGLHIVMEYVEGETVGTLMRQQSLSLERILDIGIHLMDALAHAHEHGILHRDIKPGNIVVSPEGRVKVLDFGLAKIWDPATPLRRSTKSVNARVVIGTLGYMAPERLLHRESDHRADIFSAGAVLFELLTSRVPYEGPDYAALAIQAMGKGPPAPHHLNAGVPTAISEVVAKAVAREPQDRYQSALAFRHALEQVAAALCERGTAPAQEFRRPHRLPPQRIPRTALRRAGGVAAVVIIAIAIWATWSVTSQPPGAHAFKARDWVLIADFENRTGEPSFSYALRTALETSLQQSAYVNVFSRSQIFDSLRRMRRTDATLVDEPTALEIAKREGIPVIVSGSALASGNTFQLGARAVETATGRLLFIEMARFRNKDDLFEEVESLALAVRQKLGETMPPSDDGAMKILIV